MRVLAPEGVLLTGAADALLRTVKPMDERMDVWSHWEANEFNHGTNDDELVAPSTSMRWSDRTFPSFTLRANGGVVTYSSPGDNPAPPRAVMPSNC